MDFSPEALGREIFERRSAKGMTQAALGAAAGYKAGAGVTISRIEHGHTRPRQAKLEALAEALDLTGDQLVTAAAERTTKMAKAGDGGGTGGRRRTEGRPKRVQHELERRKRVSEQLCSAFDDAHRRASEDFLVPFIDVASQLVGAPARPVQLDDVRGDDARAEAKLKMRYTSAGVSKALSSGSSYAADAANALARLGADAVGPVARDAAVAGAFRLAVYEGISGTGVPVSQLHGAARWSAAHAAIGGGPYYNGGKGIAGGLRRLRNLGIGAELAAGIAVVVATTAVYELTRQRLEWAARVDAQLAASQRGFAACEDLLPRATKALDDLAVHGGRALSRWSAHLGPTPLDWDGLETVQRRRYDEFVALAACQLAVTGIDFGELVETTGDAREHLVQDASGVLTEAQALIDTIV